jgi:hypothetical protein
VPQGQELDVPDFRGSAAGEHQVDEQADEGVEDGYAQRRPAATVAVR